MGGVVNCLVFSTGRVSQEKRKEKEEEVSAAPHMKFSVKYVAKVGQKRVVILSN